MPKRRPQLTEKALIEKIESASATFQSDATCRDGRAEFFIAGLCVRLECDHPRAARSLAKAAGMGFLYEEGASQ